MSSWESEETYWESEETYILHSLWNNLLPQAQDTTDCKTPTDYKCCSAKKEKKKKIKCRKEVLDCRLDLEQHVRKTNSGKLF